MAYITNLDCQQRMVRIYISRCPCCSTRPRRRQLRHNVLYIARRYIKTAQYRVGLLSIDPQYIGHRGMDYRYGRKDIYRLVQHWLRCIVLLDHTRNLYILVTKKIQSWISKKENNALFFYTYFSNYTFK